MLFKNIKYKWGGIHHDITFVEPFLLLIVRKRLFGTLQVSFLEKLQVKKIFKKT